MNKVILMSIQSKWLVKILNGEKTIEIRKSMPKCELPIDVYLYCTKGKPYITQQSNYQFTIRDTKDYTNLVNGKVVAKFTLNKIEKIITYNWESQTATLSPFDLSLKSCISIKDLNNEFVDCKAYYIDNLVIFDKPKELSEFSIFKRETISCGMDCPPYTDWVEYRVYKAPQSWQYAWLWE